MKKVFWYLVSVVLMVVILLISTSCNLQPPIDTPTNNRYISSSKAQQYILNDNVMSATDLFYSQFGNKQVRKLSSTLSNDDIDNDERIDSNDEQTLELGDVEYGDDEVVTAIDESGNTYTIIDDTMIIDYNPSDYDEPQEGTYLPCNMFDGLLQQYRDEICRAIDWIGEDGIYVEYTSPNDHMRVSFIEGDENELLYKDYWGCDSGDGVYAEGTYYSYHSYLDENGVKRIDIVNSSIYTAAKASEIKMDGRDFFKGYILNVIDGKSYHYEECYTYGDDEQSNTSGSVIDIFCDENGNVDMSSMDCNCIEYSEGYDVSTYGNPSMYELSKFYKISDDIFASVKRSKQVMEVSDDNVTDYFYLYDKTGSIIWDESGKSFGNLLGDFDGFDQIMFTLNPDRINPKFCGVYYHSDLLKNLSFLQCFAPTEEERTESVDLLTVTIDYNNIPNYLEYLSYLDEFDSVDAEDGSIIAGIKGLKCLEWLNQFDWTDRHLDENYFNIQLLSYPSSMGLYESEIRRKVREQDFKYLYYLKYLVYLKDIDVEYVNNNESQFEVFKGSDFSLDYFVDDIFVPEATMLIKAYLHDMRWSNMPVILLQNGNPVDLQGIVSITSSSFNGWDGNHIPTVRFRLSFPIDDNFDELADIFTQYGLSYKGYTDIRELREFYYENKITLPDEIDTEYMEEQCIENINHLLNVLKNFEIDDVKGFADKINEQEENTDITEPTYKEDIDANEPTFEDIDNNYIDNGE